MSKLYLSHIKNGQAISRCEIIVYSDGISFPRVACGDAMHDIIMLLSCSVIFMINWSSNMEYDSRSHNFLLDCLLKQNWIMHEYYCFAIDGIFLSFFNLIYEIEE